MKCILVHNQQSIAILIKKIISKIKPQALIEIKKSINEIDIINLEKKDMVFLLQKIGHDNEKIVSNLIRSSIVVGCGEDFQNIKLQYNMNEEMISSSKLNELMIFFDELLENINQASINLSMNQEKFMMHKHDRAPIKVDLILIGVSTGGPAFLQEFLNKISSNCTPIVIAQHLLKGFSSQLLKDLQVDCKNKIVEVSAKTELIKGQIAIAEAGSDIEIIKEESKFYAVKKKLNGDAFHPSVDRFFMSVSNFQDAIAAIILTGMGKDGTEGAKMLKNNHKFIIAQEPSTCVVDGMPKSIIENGLANLVLCPDKIINQINMWSKFS